jgi:Flp pilus assembly pilin Flp
MLKIFLRDKRGQDLIEYTLLMAFVALAAAALFVSTGSAIENIWSSVSLPQATSIPTGSGGNVFFQAILWIVAGILLTWLIVRRGKGKPRS